jgi:N-acetylglucosamine-6-phosphate deacetylase
MLALTNARVLTPQGMVEGRAVLIEDGRIVQLCGETAVPTHAKTRDLGGGILAPGFIDVQVNGGGGVLFNDAPTVEAIAAIGRAHRRFGTTGFLPTLISDDLEVVARAIDAAGRAIAEGVPGVLGVHIEGPFINEVRRGVHDATKLRKLDEQAFKLLTSLKAGRTLVTLAPETTTPDMIRRLVRAGVIVSAGHTDASYEVMREAIAAGVSGFTHLFNAMSPLTSRAPGVVGAALEHQTSWAGIIVDGHHVDPAVLRIALHCKPRNRFMLVTDAMPSVGTANASFTLQGRTITVQDGVLRAPDGSLAGAHLDMARAAHNAMTLLGLDVEQALAMASLHPAQFLGLVDRGAIVVGHRADLVLLDDAFDVQETWVAGVAASPIR